MENIEKALKYLIDLNGQALGNDASYREDVTKVTNEALKELDVLKKSGIMVVRKETYTVEGPARKRGRKAK